jgi:hypothetical protein
MIPHDIVVMNTCDIPPPFPVRDKVSIRGEIDKPSQPALKLLAIASFFYRFLPKRAMSFLEFPEV